MKLILLLLLFTTQAQAQQCLNYEPDAVTLTGTIKQHTFAGPPNYESVAKGDAAEKVWVLHLEKPICVLASADNEKENEVSDLQLVVGGSKEYRAYRSMVGRKVSATGTLFHAHTGHHHTPVLLTVKTIQQAKP